MLDILPDRPVSVLVISGSGELDALINTALTNHAAYFDITYAGTLKEARRLVRSLQPDLVLTEPLVPDGSCQDVLLDLGEEANFPIALLAEDPELAIAASAHPAYLDMIVPAELTANTLPRILARLLREWRTTTKCRETEAELNASQDTHSRSLLLGHPVYWEWDCRSDRLSYCSDDYAALFEMTVEAALQHFTDDARDLSVVHDEDKGHYLQAVADANAIDGPLQVEYRILTRSGAVKHVRELSNFELDENGDRVCR